jgi:hypothetical protein
VQHFTPSIVAKFQKNNKINRHKEDKKRVTNQREFVKYLPSTRKKKEHLKKDKLPKHFEEHNKLSFALHKLLC